MRVSNRKIFSFFPYKDYLTIMRYLKLYNIYIVCCSIYLYRNFDSGLLNILFLSLS